MTETRTLDPQTAAVVAAATAHRTAKEAVTAYHLGGIQGRHVHNQPYAVRLAEDADRTWEQVVTALDALKAAQPAR